MAVPKRRTSRSKRNMRRANHDKVAAPNIIPCPNCGEPVGSAPRLRVLRTLQGPRREARDDVHGIAQTTRATMPTALPRSRILGTGHYLPPVVRTNFDIEKMVETSDAWITERTGIKERRIAPEGVVTSDMATAAGKAALEMAGLKATDLDMIIVGTVTPDMPMPATAVFVQQKLGAGVCPAFDLSAACAGFVFGLSIADQFIALRADAPRARRRGRAAFARRRLDGPHHLRPLRRRRGRGGARPGGREAGRREAARRPVDGHPHRRGPRPRAQHPRRRQRVADHARHGRSRGSTTCT